MWRIPRRDYRGISTIRYHHSEAALEIAINTVVYAFSPLLKDVDNF